MEEFLCAAAGVTKAHRTRASPERQLDMDSGLTCADVGRRRPYGAAAGVTNAHRTRASPERQLDMDEVLRAADVDRRRPVGNYQDHDRSDVVYCTDQRSNWTDRWFKRRIRCARVGMAEPGKLGLSAPVPMGLSARVPVGLSAACSGGAVGACSGGAIDACSGA